ncbi:hypothetical protein BDN72DRAFT_873631 [Pluteus cervinus]|uniref:Uncharacterized protein n=1 Tax=Pluteus cervinus TaxID=181527 RepID=A0ACD3BH98_9AGAR|nr:hypothetical protein BDN72DRAFT_873631 [Pluteus cervinus]
MTTSHVRSLYRTCLRQVNKLPHVYVRHFFRLKFADDFRAIYGHSNNVSLTKRKLKRVEKTLRKIQGAHAGHVKAFAHVLDMAYGRKGKLRWELMEPLVLEPNIGALHQPFQNPIYSLELKALLTTPYSRTTKPLNPEALVNPPKLPARADPSSEEARLLGRLSRRREMNLRWRYFTQEWKKVRPPVELAVPVDSSMKLSDEVGTLQHKFPLNDVGILDHILELVGSPARPLTRRERKGVEEDSTTVTRARHPSRWLRRRYLSLLGRIPVITLQNYRRGHTGYHVSLSPIAISPSLHGTHGRLAEVDADVAPWLKGFEDVEK